jgi:hypothetical protein
MRIGSPFSESMRAGTVDKGVRSEFDDDVKVRREAIRGGEDDMIWVDDVGTGVGYVDTIP